MEQVDSGVTLEVGAEITQERSNRSWWWIAGGALLLGVLLGWAVMALLGATYTYHGTVIQSPQQMADFTLTGPEGTAVSLSDFRGQAVMLYFGYTFCPDVCPATMVELAQARALLGRDADKLQVLMVSIDPLRDTPERLGEYVRHFDPSFIGLTGSEDDIAAAATPFGIFYEKHAGSAASGYLIDHTASVVVLDQDGYLRLIYPFGTAGADIAEDLEHLIK